MLYCLSLFTSNCEMLHANTECHTFSLWAPIFISLRVLDHAPFHATGCYQLVKATPRMRQLSAVDKLRAQAKIPQLGLKQKLIYITQTFITRRRREEKRRREEEEAVLAAAAAAGWRWSVCINRPLCKILEERQGRWYTLIPA